MLPRVISTITIAAFASLTQLPSDTYAQQISVVVPALRNAPPSRDAHFNWVFESSGGGNVQYGQFACGSYWVAPAVGDNSVKLISLTGNPAWTDYLSCDADPIVEKHGLLDGSKNYGNYDASENLLSNLPAVITPPAGSCVSLVAAMQRNEAETSGGGTAAIVGEVADAYCVITVLDAAPPNGGADMIRPNITGATKEFLTWNDFDLSRLPSYAFLSGNSSNGWENVRIKWSHSIEIFGGFSVETSPGQWTGFSEGGRAFRAHILTHDYASGMASSFNNDVLALFSEDDIEDKRAALAAMLAFGLDLYHARYDYGSDLRKSWTSGAGQHAGKILPVALLAALQIDQSKSHELRKVAIHNHGDDRALLGPQELRQIPRSLTGVPIWGDGYPIFRSGNNVAEADRRYWADFKGSSCYDGALGTCNTSVGKKTAVDPYLYHDGPANKPGASYMMTAVGTIRGVAAAMILMPEIRSIINTDAPIEFIDRIERHGIWAYPDPVAIISETEQQNPSCDVWRWGQGCVEYGVTWGPDPSDVRFAIEDGVGRFVSRHGATASSNYESARAQSNWSTIITYYDGETFEDTEVPLGTLPAPDLFFETGAQPKAHLYSYYPDAEIRYTLDGSTPTSGSTLYTAPVSVSLGTTVKARAFAAGMTQSPVKERVYTGAFPPSARIEQIVASTSDREIYDTGGAKWPGQANIRVGGSGSGIDAAAVFPFELPVLQPGEVITGATLYLHLEYISGSPTCVLDLYGLDYRSTSGVNAATDYFEGPYGTDTAATPIDDAFATISSQPGELVTDSTGFDNLVDYINAQYANGAQGGDFIFLRLNPSIADEGNFKYWVISSADSSTPEWRPLLAVEISAP